MNTDIKDYVESLFSGYERTPELDDFKEEIATNMTDRMKDLQSSGMNREDSFTKVVAELGDITTIADEISRQKRNEVINKMYINDEVKMNKKHALGYALTVGVFLFGIITALLTYFSTLEISHSIAASMPFMVTSLIAFVFLRFTQETTRNYPMPIVRAVIYALASGIMLFGFIISSMLFFDSHGWEAIIGTLIPFVIPPIVVIGFLIMTEKKRYKPWAIEEKEFMIEQYAHKYRDTQFTTNRGLLSGALWILSLGIFAFIWMTFSLKYAFFVIIVAIIGEIMIEYWIRVRVDKMEKE